MKESALSRRTAAARVDPIGDFVASDTERPTRREGEDDDSAVRSAVQDRGSGSGRRSARCGWAWARPRRSQKVACPLCLSNPNWRNCPVCPTQPRFPGAESGTASQCLPGAPQTTGGQEGFVRRVRRVRGHQGAPPAPNVQMRMRRHPRKEPFMANSTPRTVLTIADLVEAAFDRTRTVTTDRRVAAALAARTVARCLARTGRLDLGRRLDPGSCSEPRPAR
jgi:hypothetical protein